MKILHHKKAFTLLEVIFVTVILGIVASIGSSIIVQVYESYIMQRSVHNASLKTELAINQLSNRLTYRISKSLLARVPDSNGTAPADALALSEVPTANTTHTALEWIGYDNDGFSAQTTPAWSGFADLNVSNFTQVTTIGSRLTTPDPTIVHEQMILNNLSRSAIAPAPAILFRGPDTYRNPAVSPSREYNTTCMHQIDGQGCMFPVALTADNTLTFVTGEGDRTTGQMVYSEFYQLAASAYAVVPLPTDGPGPNGGRLIAGNVEVWDLYFFADYQPWNGMGYAQGSRALLARNVSVFRFRQESGGLRLKLCTVEVTDTNNTISICKEKAVIK